MRSLPGPEAEGERLMGTIVVGVDGSDGSVAALHWAAEEAHLRRAELVVVTCWDMPAVMYDAPGQVMPMALDPETYQQASEDALSEVLAAAAPQLEGVSVTRSVRGGGAPDELVAAAEETGADLLVVGSRGLSGLSGLLLGSVSHHVAQHAPCPVVIIRDPDDRKD